MRTIRSRLIAIGILLAIAVWQLIPTNVTQRVRDATTGRMKDTTIRRVPINLGLDLQGGIHLALEVDQSKGPVPDCADAISRAERVVRSRIDQFGTTEPVVQIVGRCRLVVELPGEKDPARAKSIIQRTAFLEFRITDMQNLFRDAIAEIDRALREAGVRAPGQAGAGAANVAQLFGADTAKAKQGKAPAKGKAAKDTTDLNAPGALSSLLFQGSMPRGMSRRTSGRASRLSATGTCSSGTRYSPGIEPWNSSDDSAPGAFRSVVSLAALPLAGAFPRFALAVSAPNSCATLAAPAPACPGARTPASRNARSISGIASRNRFCMSVIRNSRKAVR